MPAAGTASSGTATPPAGPILFRGILACPLDPRVSSCEGKPAYRSAIYVIPRVGAPARRLTNRRFDDSQPAWSPDRRLIAFARGTPTGGVQVWVTRADGTDARRITRGGVETEPAWSPDGRWIAFRGGTRTFDIYVVHPDGTGRRNVTRNAAGVGALYPTWSRDGSRVAFQRTASPAGSGVYSIGIDGKRLRRLARGGLEPDWSPNGHRIAFIRREPASDPGWQVLTMGVNGGAVRRVTRGGSTVSPHWSPDSSWLAFARNDQVAIVRADGSGLRRLTTRRPGFTVDGNAG